MDLKGALRPTLLDRYIVREMLAPTGLGLLLFTFILLLQSITQLLGILIARSAEPTTILKVFFYLLPSIFAVTIPMAFLLGVLLAFGRLASDSEIVALRASGISPARLLRPVVALATLAGLATFWVMAVALPAANQAHRQTMFALIVNKARTGVKPRVFSDDNLVPGMVLYVSDIPAETGQWKDIFIHDVRDQETPRVILARTGHILVDDGLKAVSMHLEDGAVYSVKSAEPATDRFQRFASSDFPLPTEAFFPATPLSKGDREMTLGELEERIQATRAEGKRPLDVARFRVEWHKKFAIPVACLVFGLLGLGLSLGTKKEARSAAFALSIGVIFVYYVFIRLGEQAGDTGMLPPALAMWGANIVLAIVAFLLLALNHREAAFDPLDPSHYTAWIPRLRRAEKPPVAAATGGPRRPVVVLRFPRPGLPTTFPGILDRYIGWQYLGHLALILTAFCSIYVLVHFMDLFDDIQQHRVKGSVVVHFYTFYVPMVAHLMMPVAVLVATLTTFGLMSRRNEITALKASGVSLYRGTLSVVVLGLMASLGLFAAGEFLLPATNRVANQDFNVIKGRPPQVTSLLHRRWIVGSDGRFYNYDQAVMIDPVEPMRGLSLYGLWIYDLDVKQWQLRERTYARRAVWQPDPSPTRVHQDTWSLEQGWRRSFRGTGAFEAFSQVRTRDFEPPTYFMREEREAETLRFGELRSHIATLESMGLDVTKLRVQLYRKPAFPLIGIVMTLIGIPFSFVVGRRGALYGIGISLVIAIVYWATLAIFEALGNNALLPPLLAAWAPNLLFAAAGLYLMLTLET
jgi:LPS export ABC transporter permease LptF/LPS export ABC transporter permease LptG